MNPWYPQRTVNGLKLAVVPLTFGRARLGVEDADGWSYADVW